MLPLSLGTLTRVISIDALTHIFTRRIHVDKALEKLFTIHQARLRPLDKAFIYEIVFGTLRWTLKVDWILSHMLDRPMASLDPRVVNAMRVGAYQIYYMDRVPDRAAVSETVEAIKNVGVPNASSLVNAVLRRVARKSEYFPQPDKENFPIDYFSIQHAFPRWMVERWYRQLPPEKFEYLMINSNFPPLNTLKVINRNSLPDGENNLALYLLKTQSIECSWQNLSGALRVQRMPDLFQCQAFLKGCYIVQDEAAQLAITLAAPKPDETFLDACASPGGKSIFLWEAGVSPSRLTVCDVSQKKIGKILENFQRVGLVGSTILYGDVVEQCRGKVFDKIVLDAPCSCMGTIRRHPEIKWLKSYTDIVKCAEEQTRLLDGLANCVAVDGELLYIVCSFEYEETTDQINRFLEKHPEFEKLSPHSRVNDFYKKYITRSDELLIYSGNSDNLDGFFAVILKKNRLESF